MGRRAGIDRAAVIEAAAQISDRNGLGRLTLARVAERLGVQSPSLYYYVDGVEGLRRELAIHGAGILAAEMEAAVQGRDSLEALRAVGHAYRRFARRHPGLYEAFLPAPRPGEDEERYQALAAPVQVLVGVLANLGVEGSDAIGVIRALRSFLHGFVTLERDGGFGMPEDPEEAFEQGLALILIGLQTRFDSPPLPNR